jgi:Flp pilus assembly protein TadD
MPTQGDNSVDRGGVAGVDDEALSDAQNRLARAVLLYSLHRSGEAIEVLKLAIEAAPRVPDLPILLAWIFHERHDSANARTAFAHALSIVPNHPDALYGMGLVLFDTGEFALAAEHFERALAEDPSDQHSRLCLVACLLELGQTDVAPVWLRQETHVGNFYGKALKILISSSRGRFWLRPSAAAKFLSGDPN